MSMLKNLKEKATIDFTRRTAPDTTAKKSTAPIVAEVADTTIHKGLTPASLGRNAAMQRNEIFKENESLKEELKSWEGVRKAVLLDPSLIKPSQWANRHVGSFKTEEYSELVAEIAHAQGNIQPIKVRPLSHAAGQVQQYEIVFGHRRHQACLELGIPVLALIEYISDATLFIEMDRENRQRVDLRPFEQGNMYKQALDAGLYPSLSALCAATGASQGKSSIALRLARANPVLLDAFVSPLDIQFRWVPELLEAFEKNPKALLELAQDLKSKRESGEALSAKKVFAELTGITTLQKVEAEDNPIKRPIEVNGKAIASITFAKGCCSVEFKKGRLSLDQVERLDQAIKSIFE